MSPESEMKGGPRKCQTEDLDTMRIEIEDASPITGFKVLKTGRMIYGRPISNSELKAALDDKST